MTIRVDYLFFDMNSYFASVAQNEEPDLIGRPVGILTTDSAGAGCIAASYEAKVRGVRMGTRQHEARQICPGIVFRPAKHDVCVDYHHRIRAAVDQVIPISEAHSVDEFSCKLMGRERHLPKALEIAQQLQDVLLRDVGPAMKCSVGVAPSVLLAKIAAEMKKPMGINWLHPSVLPQKIAHLDRGDIPGVSKGILARLDAAGVDSVTRLYALAPKKARAIWGNVVGEKVIRGLHGELVTWDRKSGQSIGHGQRLTTGNTTPNGARLVGRRLLVKAAARLRRSNHFTRYMSVSVSCERMGRQNKAVALLPTQDTFVLLDAFADAWATFQVHAPRSVGIMLGNLGPLETQTQDMFAPRNMDGPNPREELCHALDALNQRFGQDTVRFGQLPLHRVPYTGAKIAFSRIPEIADFSE